MTEHPDNRAKEHEYKQIIDALREKQVDAVVGEGYVAVVRLREAEQALQRAKQELEQRVQERTEQLKEKNLQLENYAAQLRTLASELTLAEQRERQRLAKILHDHLQQLVAAAKFNVSAISAHTDDEFLTTMADEAAKLLEESIQTSRSLAVDLSPPVLTESGLVAALEWLCRWMEQKHHLKVQLRADNHADIKQEDAKRLIFDCVRELLFNTAKHAHVPSATVEVSREDGYGRVTVSDKGSGFDMSKLKPGRHKGQTGFGLLNMHERISLFGGRLEVDSRPGKGSNFTIILPVSIHKDTKQAKLKKIGAKKIPIEEIKVRKPSHKVRVLLVDDHKVMLQGLSALLRREPDIEIAGQAYDGRQAVIKTRELNPDVILMDYAMPGMNGVEAARIISAENSDVRIIGLSMYDEPELANAMTQAGASAFLSKSGPSNRLIEHIRAVVHPRKN